MKLLILGATGGCGGWATGLATDRGHDVRALVREATRFDAPDGVEVHEGSALDREVLVRALTGVGAVLSCLGLRRRHPWNPWSSVTSPPTLTATVARLLVDEMPRHGVSRLIAISAGGVGDSAGHVHPFNRRLFRHSKINVSYRDLEHMERILGASGLDWHAVRPTTLTNGPHTGNAAVVEYYGLLTRVSRADVADWMLDALEGDRRPAPTRTPMIAVDRSSARI